MPFPYEAGSALHDLSIVLTYLWPMVLQLELALRPLGVVSAIFETAPLSSVLAMLVDLQAQSQMFPVTWAHHWALQEVHGSQSLCVVKPDTQAGHTPVSSLACLATTRARALKLLNKLFEPASKRSSTSVPSGRTDFIGHRASLPKGMASGDSTSGGEAALAAPVGSLLEAVCSNTHSLLWCQVQAACTAAAVNVGVTGAGLITGQAATSSSAVPSLPRVSELDYDSEVDFSEETLAVLRQSFSYLLDGSPEAVMQRDDDCASGDFDAAGGHDGDGTHSFREHDSHSLDASTGVHYDGVKIGSVKPGSSDRDDDVRAAVQSSPHTKTAAGTTAEFSELHAAALLHYKPLYDASEAVLLASKECACGDSVAANALSTSLLAALIAYGLDAPRLADHMPLRHGRIYTEAALLSPDICITTMVQQSFGPESTFAQLGGAAAVEASQLHASLTRTVSDVRKLLFEEFWEDDFSDDSLQPDAATAGLAADADDSSLWLGSPLFISPAAVTVASLTEPPRRNPMATFEKRFRSTMISRHLPSVQVLREDGSAEVICDVPSMAAFDHQAMVQSLTWNVRYALVLLFSLK